MLKTRIVSASMLFAVYPSSLTLIWHTVDAQVVRCILKPLVANQMAEKSVWVQSKQRNHTQLTEKV